MSETNKPGATETPAPQPQKPVSSVTADSSINEETGIGLTGILHGLIGIGGLGAAWKFAASDQMEAALGAGAVGLAFAFNTAMSTWFQQDQNQATITTFFGKKKGNITGGGIKFKQPWPWRAKYDTVHTYVQSKGDTIENIKTRDDVFVEKIEYDVFFKIVDPATYVFSAKNREEQMMIKVANHLRGKVANSIALLHELVDDAAADQPRRAQKSQEDAFDLYADRQVIEDAVMAEVNDYLRSEYGIQIVSLPIKEPKLVERFVNAAAKRMETIQEGLAREAFLESEGRGYAKQRKQMFAGYAELAKELFDKNIFSTVEAAVHHVEFMVGRETVRDAARNGAMVLADGQTSGQEGLAHMMAVGRLVMNRMGVSENDLKTMLAGDAPAQAGAGKSGPAAPAPAV